MSSKDNLNAQIEHLQSKYTGTGHPDTTKFDWLQNQHRDSVATYIGHHSLLSYFATAEGESLARYRTGLIDKMYKPCGKAPATDDEMEQ